VVNKKPSVHVLCNEEQGSLPEPITRVLDDPDGDEKHILRIGNATEKRIQSCTTVEKGKSLKPANAAGSPSTTSDVRAFQERDSATRHVSHSASPEQLHFQGFFNARDAIQDY